MDVPKIFENCSNYYWDKMSIYSNCSNSSNPCENLKNMYTLSNVMFWTIFLIPSTILVSPAVANIYILTVIFRKFTILEDGLKMRYVFITSRIISSILITINTIYLPIPVYITDFNFWILTIYSITEELSFLTYIGSMALFTATIHLAITHPFFHRRHFTLQRCIALMSLIWILSLILSIFNGVFQSAYMAHNSPFKCSYNNCEQPVILISISCVLLCFVLIIGLQIYAIISLHKNILLSKRRKDFSNCNIQENIKRRLISVCAMCVITFTFEITSFSILLSDSQDLEESYSDSCRSFYRSAHRLQPFIVVGIVTIFWSIGLLFDPIFIILYDDLIYQEFQKTFPKFVKLFSKRKQLNNTIA